MGGKRDRALPIGDIQKIAEDQFVPVPIRLVQPRLRVRERDRATTRRPA